MNSQRKQSLARRIRSRIRELETRYGCSAVIGKASFRSAKDVSEAAHAHVNYEYPYSAYLLLQCMLWTLCPSVPIRQGEWRSDLDTLLFLLAAVPDVHGPRDAAVHQEEFSTWDHTDVRLVRAWLDIVSQCTFVRECCRDESEKARSFWDALLRRHDGGEKTSDIA